MSYCPNFGVVAALITAAGLAYLARSFDAVDRLLPVSLLLSLFSKVTLMRVVPRLVFGFPKHRAVQKQTSKPAQITTTPPKNEVNLVMVLAGTGLRHTLVYSRL